MKKTRKNKNKRTHEKEKKNINKYIGERYLYSFCWFMLEIKGNTSGEMKN